MSLYDTIGADYAKHRPADSRIVDALGAALGLMPPCTLLDVGAGTAKYARALAERGFTLIAVEPSEVMRSQIVPHDRVRVIPATAEEIPLPAGAADGAFVILALHHFSDRRKALNEILRVIGDGRLVIFSFEPRALARFWLADYFPKLGRERPSSYSELEDVAAEVRMLTGRVVRSVPFPLPRDLEDRFAAAGWATPESYLDPQVRSGISSFSLMPSEEVDNGVRRLAEDIASGEWDRKHGWLRNETHLDVGYRFIIAT
jgi:ubiquinone/menaquinone biosynthesis C-methylase UbiE